MDPVDQENVDSEELVNNTAPFNITGGYGTLEKMDQT